MTGKKAGVPLPVILASVFVFVFCNLFSYFVFNHIPHVHDEIDYLFQAKLFRSGRLFAPSPCAKEAFDFPHMINNGRWYSQYTPGYPFLLTLGLIKLYSKEFEAFLDRLYEQNNFADVDADRLQELGISYKKMDNFKDAAFCFEAALQVENDPETRRTLLQLLIPCYQKSGQMDEAKNILDFMEKVSFDERKLYSVFPERGF